MLLWGSWRKLQRQLCSVRIQSHLVPSFTYPPSSRSVWHWQRWGRGQEAEREEKVGSDKSLAGVKYEEDIWAQWSQKHGPHTGSSYLQVEKANNVDSGSKPLGPDQGRQPRDPSLLPKIPKSKRSNLQHERGKNLDPDITPVVAEMNTTNGARRDHTLMSDTGLTHQHLDKEVSVESVSTPVVNNEGEHARGQLTRTEKLEIESPFPYNQAQIKKDLIRRTASSSEVSDLSDQHKSRMQGLLQPRKKSIWPPKEAAAQPGLQQTTFDRSHATRPLDPTTTRNQVAADEARQIRERRSQINISRGPYNVTAETAQPGRVSNRSDPWVHHPKSALGRDPVHQRDKQTGNAKLVDLGRPHPRTSRDVQNIAQTGTLGSATDNLAAEAGGTDLQQPRKSSKTDFVFGSLRIGSKYVPINQISEAQSDVSATERVSAKLTRLSTGESPAVTLLDELFPEEAAKLRATSTEVPRELRRDIPKLRLETADAHDGPTEIQRIRKQTEEQETVKIRDTEDFRNGSVLVLRNACKSLDESDFRRLLPRGKHIRDWIGDGDIKQGMRSTIKDSALTDKATVIRYRDPVTLRLLGHYFIVFSSPKAAMAYKQNVERLQKLVEQHSQRDLLSPIAIPTDYEINGENAHAALQSYTLIAPKQKLELHVFEKKEASPEIREVIAQGGYHHVVSRGAKPKTEVLFHVYGINAELETLRSSILQDGWDRGLSWTLAKTNRGFTPLDLGPRRADDDDDDDKSRADESSYAGTRVRRKTGSHRKWIIGFQSEVEAKRFVRIWHRRPFAVPEALWYKETAPLVHAELLW